MTKSKKSKCVKGKAHHYLIEEYVDAQARWVKNGSTGTESKTSRKLKGTCTFCGYNRYFAASGSSATYNNAGRHAGKPIVVNTFGHSSI